MCPDLGPGIILWVAPVRPSVLSLGMNGRLKLSGFLLALALPLVAQATPRMAASYAQDCGLCHVNPSGGGLRNTYASQYILPSEMSLRPLPAHEREKWPSPRITDQITIGVDMRTLYFAEFAKDETPSSAADAGRLAAGHSHESHGPAIDQNSFFQMQGDVYLAFEPDPGFLIYLDKGLYSGFEAFLLARVLPLHGYLKAGQFVPDIGWRWDDHRRLTRQALSQDYDRGRVTDVGLEAAISPGAFTVTAGVFNGSLNPTFDDNSQKMVVGRALYRTRLGKVHAAIGGSARHNHGTLARETVWGGQAQAAFGSRFAYIADAFATRTTVFSSGLGAIYGWVTSQELDFQVRRGLDLYFGYDFHDPDTDRESGAHTLISLGMRVYPRHYFQVQPILRWEEIGDVTLKRFEVILHGFY